MDTEIIGYLVKQYFLWCGLAINIVAIATGLIKMIFKK